MSVHHHRLSALVVTLGFLGGGLVACSSSDGGGNHTGGTTGSGGTVGTGGRSGTGGAASTGGSNGTGGAVGSGGSVGTGGTSASGGSVGAGGKGSGGAPGAGGTSATGGSANGGSAAGGGAGTTSVGKGGSAGTGPGVGGSVGGTTGGPDGGGAGAGGSTTPQTSAGCGSANPLKTSNTLTETINGTARKWMLDVPTNYDGTKPYRLIFVWHPLGGSGSQVVSGGYNGLKSLSGGSAVFATADGLNGSNSETSGVGWWNANGGDMKLLQAMLDKINAGLCIDQTRIFSTGFSFGGMMSYTVPFEFNVFRAVAPCSGKTGVIPYDAKFDGPVPIMAFHGDSDTFVATNLGKAFFDKFAARNKCGTQTQPVSPSGCVQYQGCVVPSIWCLFSGGHTTWSEEPAAIWKFFSQF
jgi:polyhydroxybutyrate depolymerase